MADRADILVIGTGFLAERLICDLAIVADRPVTLAVAGRNPDKARWLADAGNARAAMFGRPFVAFATPIGFATAEAMAETIAKVRPRAILQAASLQSPGDVRKGETPWARLLNQAGGFGATGLLQMVLTARAARATQLVGGEIRLVNACYPDLVNQALMIAGLPVACGLGNVAIIAALFAAHLGVRESATLKVLAHHQNLSALRLPAEERGIAPRVWLRGEEIPDVGRRFADVRLPNHSLNPLAGATGVDAMRALIGHRDYVGHVPGPEGLPGGYPVTIRGGRIALDLPPGVSRDQAVAFNRQLESLEGLAVGADGRVSYSERARQAFAAASRDIADGFHVRDIEPAAAALLELRRRLGGEPAASR